MIGNKIQFFFFILTSEHTNKFQWETQEATHWYQGRKGLRNSGKRDFILILDVFIKYKKC